jgi:hypothetical protein
LLALREIAGADDDFDAEAAEFECGLIAKAAIAAGDECDFMRHGMDAPGVWIREGGERVQRGRERGNKGTGIRDEKSGEVEFMHSHPFHKEREMDGARNFLTLSVKILQSMGALLEEVGFVRELGWDNGS